MPLPPASIGPAASLPSNRSSRPSGPFAETSSRAGLLLGRGDAIETEQPEQRAGSIGLELAVDTDIGAGQRAQVGHHERLALAGRARRDVDADGADLAGEADLAAGAIGAAAFHADAGLQRRGLLAGREPAQRPGQRRRKLFRQRQDAVEIARIEIDGDAAARRRLRLDPAGRNEAGIAEVADRQPLDRESAGIELEARGDVARVEAGNLGAADLHRQRDFARPLQPQAGQRGLAEAEHAVEIELGGAKLAIETRRPVAGRPRVGHAALDHAAIDFGAQLLDRDPVRPERHVALGAPGLVLRRRGGLAGEPGHQVLGIVGVDAGAAGKAEPLAQRIETPVDLDLGEPGRAKLEPVERPGGAVRSKIAGDVLHRRAAERHGVDVERKLDRP